MSVSHRLASIALAAALVACEKERPPAVSLDVPFVPEDTPAADGGLDADPDAPVGPDAPSPDAADAAPGDGATMDVPGDGAPRDDGQPADASDAGPGDGGGGDGGVFPGPGPARLVAPPSGTQTRSRRPAFRWTAVTGAARYRVEFSTTRSFAVVDTATLDATGPTATPATDLPAGLRFWRVVAFDAEGAMGRPSAPWAVTLGRPYGDVNGDGYSDVVVGAPNVNVGGLGTGRVYVFRGGESADTVADVTLTGEGPGTYFGTSVSAGGDINNDGIADVVVGAPFADGTGMTAGRAYVFLGGAAFSDRPAVVLQGAIPAGEFGASVAIVGDVNGDGYADVVVGAGSARTTTGALSGQAYLFLGGAPMDATPDATLTFAAAGDRFGASVAGAGDANGDGLADVIVGAPRNDGPRGEDSGAAYVFLGAERFDTIVDRTLTGEGRADLFGFSVAGAGDVNGDGYADVVAGAFEGDAAGDNAGQAYVYLGGAASAVPPPVVLRGAAARDTFGRAVAGAGDLNNDGFDDVVVGAPGANVIDGQPTGRAYVFLGGAVFDVTSDVTFTSLTGGDTAGWAVGAAGDVNGDGFGDMLVGGTYAPFRGRGGPGSAFLFRGAATLSGTPSASFAGAEGGDQFGTSVAWRRPRGRRAPGG